MGKKMKSEKRKSRMQQRKIEKGKCQEREEEWKRSNRRLNKEAEERKNEEDKWRVRK